jgi:hypothetical protein
MVRESMAGTGARVVLFTASEVEMLGRPEPEHPNGMRDDIEVDTGIEQLLALAGTDKSWTTCDNRSLDMESEWEGIEDVPETASR